jgi:hypothetical protein
MLRYTRTTLPLNPARGYHHLKRSCLDIGDPQTRIAITVERFFPGEKLLLGKLIASAGLRAGDAASAHRGQNQYGALWLRATSMPYRAEPSDRSHSAATPADPQGEDADHQADVAGPRSGLPRIGLTGARPPFPSTTGTQRFQAPTTR